MRSKRESSYGSQSDPAIHFRPVLGLPGCTRLSDGRQVKLIRILMVEMPQMLCDIMTDLVRNERDMEIVATLSERAALATWNDEQVDVVLLGTTSPVHLERDASFAYDIPRARLLTVSVRGPECVMYELRPD